ANAQAGMMALDRDSAGARASGRGTRDSGLQRNSDRIPSTESRVPAVSVLVPAKDEAENLPLFMEQAAAVFATQPHAYEVIVVDDGSVDRTWAVLQELAERYPFLRLARHRAPRGIAGAPRTRCPAATSGGPVFDP